jgi:hypothetical protein
MLQWYVVSPSKLHWILFMSAFNFWPLDYDPDGEIYENVAWDLPGFRPRKKTTRKPASQARLRRNSEISHAQHP